MSSINIKDNISELIQLQISEKIHDIECEINNFKKELSKDESYFPYLEEKMISSIVLISQLQDLLFHIKYYPHRFK